MTFFKWLLDLFASETPGATRLPQQPGEVVPPRLIVVRLFPTPATFARSAKDSVQATLMLEIQAVSSTVCRPLHLRLNGTITAIGDPVAFAHAETLTVDNAINLRSGERIVIGLKAACKPWTHDPPPDAHALLVVIDGELMFESGQRNHSVRFRDACYVPHRS